MPAPRPLVLSALALSLLAGAVACTGDDGPEVFTGAPLRTAADVPRAAPRTEVVGGTSVRLEEGPNSVLTAVVTIRSDTPVRPVVVARSVDHEVRVPPPDAPVTEIEVPVAGLRAEETYAVEVGGSPDLVAASADLSFTTRPLPITLPRIKAVATPDARPGITLFNASPSVDDLEQPGKLLGVDQDGEVVWYHEAEQNIADVRQLANGNLFFNYGNVGAREVDLLGNVVREYTTRLRYEAGPRDEAGRLAYGPGPIVIDEPRLHHEVAFPLPNGNFLALGMEVRTVAGFLDDTCGADDPLPDGPRPIRADHVIEFTPRGEVVHRLSLADSLDPVTQQGVRMCETKTDELVVDGEFVDWTHANSATLFEEQNAVLVSARNINSVMALRWEADEDGPAGEVLWQFGPGLDIELTEGEYAYQQHAPEVQPDGTILLYDNGNERPGTVPAGGDEAPYSRAVQYELDLSGPPDTWTARQVWEHRLTEPTGEPTFADFLGDADSIGDGHVLITHGAVVDPVTGYFSGRVVEVDRATGGVVLDLRVLADPEGGWRVYRAEHLDTLYPTDPGPFFPPDPVLPLPGD